MRKFTAAAFCMLLIATTQSFTNKVVTKESIPKRDTIVKFIKVDGEIFNFEDYRKTKLLKQLGLTGTFHEQTYLLKRDKYFIEISNASKEFGIDIHLIEAVIICESRWSEKAVSPEGATGLMQVMNGSTNPKLNIRSGTSILARYINLCDDDLLMGLTAYNMGIGGAKRNGKPNAYAYKVLKMWFYLNYINS